MAGIASSSKTRLATLIHNSALALIGDTLDFSTLGFHDLHGSTLDAKSIIDSINADGVYYHVWAAVKRTLDERNTRRIPTRSLLKVSIDRLLFDLADVILPRVDGPHFTFVDPRKHGDMISMIRNARRLVSLFEQNDVPKSKVVVSIPATFDGIRAAQVLESEHGIHTNLYLVSGLLHPAACAEAAATTITVPVGRLFDWYERRRKSKFDDPANHPGTETIQASTEYFKLHRIKTKIIGSGFRSLSEIVPLAAGLDAICLSKDQADAMGACEISSSVSMFVSPGALLRARQALYPTQLLSAHAGLTSAMAPETRATMAGILYASLKELTHHMDALESVVALELAGQYESRTLDLKSLYHAWNGRPQGGGLDPENGVSGWSSSEEEEDQGRLGDVRWTAREAHEIDDVF